MGKKREEMAGLNKHADNMGMAFSRESLNKERLHQQRWDRNSKRPETTLSDVANAYPPTSRAASIAPSSSRSSIPGDTREAKLSNLKESLLCTLEDIERQLLMGQGSSVTGRSTQRTATTQRSTARSTSSLNSR